MSDTNRINFEKTYRRMLQQEKFIQAVIKVSDDNGLYDNLSADVDSKCGTIEIGNVEDIVEKYYKDVKWLEKNLSIVETRFAYVVKKVVEADESMFDNLKEVFYDLGKEVDPEYEGLPMIEIYRIIRDLLLDGGRSEEFNKIVEESFDEVVWTRARPTTMKYWTYLDIDFNKYYTPLRREFIMGVIDKTDIEFVVLEDGVISLVRR